MNDRSCKLYMPHPFSSRFSRFNTYTASFTNCSFILLSFILTTRTFVIFYRAEDSLTEQTVFFRFERSVIYGLRFFDFSTRPASNGLRRCELYLNAGNLPLKSRYRHLSTLPRFRTCRCLSRFLHHRRV